MTKFGVAPEARLAMVHVIDPVVPTDSEEQVHPTGGVKLWKVLFGGTGMVTVTLAAVPGPRLVTTEVKVTLVPALTVPLLALTATFMSDCVLVASVVVAEAVLLLELSSDTLDVTDAVSVSFPDGFVLTTVNTMFAVARAASEGPEHVNCVPTNAVQFHEAGFVVTFTVPVPAGMVSVTITLVASLGPLLVIAWV
jgi:hypothetical protein